MSVVVGVFNHFCNRKIPLSIRCCRGQEFRERTVRLPEDEPEIFTIYVHWLYYSKLPVICDEKGDLRHTEYLNLAKAYTLGDKLMDVTFQDATIDAIAEASQEDLDYESLRYPGAEVVQYAYHNTKESASIRKFLADMFLMAGTGTWLSESEDRSSVPQPFLFEPAAKLLDLRGGVPPGITPF